MTSSVTDERIGDGLILERMYVREQTLLSQADALDMKASYLLVVLVFLAQLSTTFLSSQNLPYFGKVSQLVSCVLLLVSGILLLFELKVKSFSNEDGAGLETWRDEIIEKSLDLEGYRKATHPEDYLRSRLVWGLIAGSKARIFENEKANKNKLSLLKLAYWIALLAFLLDILFITTVTTHLYQSSLVS